MAYEVKYRLEFKDTHGVDNKVDILYDDYAGAIIALVPASEPLMMEYLASDDDLFDPIHESIANISFICDTNFAYDELYSVGDQEWKVEFYHNGTLNWVGWIVADYYQEPYEAPPYVVTVRATCGLALLKDKLYKYQTTTPDDTYFNGRRLESQIMVDIMTKIGYQFYCFKEYVNVYDEDMNSDTDDSPMDQLKIDVDIFRDMYCDEVLKELLTKYNACIRQVGGIMCIYRPVDMTHATVYGRHFTAPDTKYPVSLTPGTFINRSAHPTNVLQVPGGVRMFQSPAKTINIRQNFGQKESWIENHRFTSDTYNGSTFKFDDWTYSSTGYAPIGNVFKGEIDGLFLPVGNLSPASAPNVSQSFAPHGVITTDTIVFEFEYNVFYYDLIDTVTISIKIKANNASKWLTVNDDLTYIWSNTEDFIEIELPANTEVGPTGWVSFKRYVASLPATGEYTITIYTPKTVSTPASSNFGIRNLRFYTTSDELNVYVKSRLGRFAFGARNDWRKWPAWIKIPAVLKSRTEIKDVEEWAEKVHTKTNAINGRDVDVDVLLGDVLTNETAIDNITEQFAGSLLFSRGTLSNVAADFVTNWAADYLGGGVVVTSSGADIIFTSQTAGVNFTGSTTITTTAGDLAGTVAATQANQVFVQQRTVITLTGTSGVATLSCNGVSENAIFDTSLAQAATDFVSDHAATFAAADVTIGIEPGTSNEGIYFIPLDAVEASIVNFSGDLNGTKTQYDSIPALKRIDTVTLTGTYGAANVLCDGTTKAATFDEAPTSRWSTRDGAEETDIIDLIADERKAQYARTRHFIQMAIQEGDTYGADSDIDLLSNYQDDLLQLSGNNRKFIPQAGEWDVVNRRWTIDLNEII